MLPLQSPSPRSRFLNLRLSDGPFHEQDQTADALQSALDAEIRIRTHDLATLGLWGPMAREVLSRFVDAGELANAAFPFGAARELSLTLPDGTRIRIWALRISYVGELGWELDWR